MIPGRSVSGPQPAQPRISPDGTRAVFTGLSSDGDNEVLLADLGSGTSVRFSEDPRDDFDPVWTPDGLAVIWSALSPNRPPFLVMRAVDGASKSEAVLPTADTAQFAGSVSSSGLLAYTHATSAGTVDVYVVPLKGPRVPQPLLSGPAREFGPEFSPDGHWIAYVSSESGANEIYVVPYPGPGAKRQVTTTGGVSPMWRRDGRELYYQTDAGLMVIDVTPQFQFSAPRLLFAGNFYIDGTEDGPRAYDAAADGKRFLMIQLSPAVAPPPTLDVLVNWTVRREPRYCFIAASQFWTTVIDPGPPRSGAMARKRCRSGVASIQTMSAGKLARRLGVPAFSVAPVSMSTRHRLCRSSPRNRS